MYSWLALVKDDQAQLPVAIAENIPSIAQRVKHSTTGGAEFRWDPGSLILPRWVKCPSDITSSMLAA